MKYEFPIAHKTFCALLSNQKTVMVGVVKTEVWMPAIDFSQFSYFPALLAGDVEKQAFDELSKLSLGVTLPIFELTRYRFEGDFGHSTELLQGIPNDRPYLLDLDKRVAPPPYQSQMPSDPAADALRIKQQTATQLQFNTELSNLLRSTNGFENWRNLAASFPEAVPVLQFTNPASQQLNIIRQASLLAQGGRSIAIRIRGYMSEITCSIAAQILSVLPSSSQLLLVFDAGQGRKDPEARGKWIADSLDSILSQVDIQQHAGLVAVAMSNSFNAPNHNGMREVTNRDWEVWNSASETFSFRFGDYGGSPRTNDLSSFVPRSYRATVVYTDDEIWLINRHENADDPAGWVLGSQIISKHEQYAPIECWANDIIREVAEKSALGEHTTPRTWHAVRVNGHMERQAKYSQEMCI
jgi:hypothetical protein